jgi:CheY-like chemotaxis protein
MSDAPRVLIIDDDADYVAAVQHLLESGGFRVQTAPDGRQGYQLACTTHPDVILLDVMMTERTEGFFTLNRIRATPAVAETPVIVVSSIYVEHPRFRVDPEAGWLPADLFLPKPVDPSRLLEEVNRLIAARSVPS